MNPSAENHFTLTKKLFLEGMLRVSRDSYSKFALKYILLLAALWAAFLVYTLMTAGSMANVLICLVVVALLSLWIGVWTPRKHAKKAWNAQRRIYGDTMERTTTFYGDHLEIRGDCAERDIDYTDIRKVLESRNLILLLCHDRMGILLAQDGFTRGDAQTVKDLIREANM